MGGANTGLSSEALSTKGLSQPKGSLSTGDSSIQKLREVIGDLIDVALEALRR
jgi:hypothetical protein